MRIAGARPSNNSFVLAGSTAARDNEGSPTLPAWLPHRRLRIPHTCRLTVKLHQRPGIAPKPPALPSYRSSNTPSVHLTTGCR